ncbi:hypothetical protein LX32DRAFT_729988 [Colletotrichum zoysiae]|uniref:Uncharacterized protein n=1 Tax=Colletotrichum zoysiae TaxID=1216348 RepID=A0AAD9HCT5_9PEZI|nr:hypothetical protein LX32DRAFT_729988 [Colletotrichum zoysiae]
MFLISPRCPPFPLSLPSLAIPRSEPLPLQNTSSRDREQGGLPARHKAASRVYGKLAVNDSTASAVAASRHTGNEHRRKRSLVALQQKAPIPCAVRSLQARPVPRGGGGDDDDHRWLCERGRLAAGRG